MKDEQKESEVKDSDRIVNEFISEIEDKYFLDELGPGGNWKVKNGMEKEHKIIDEVKDLIYDLESENEALRELIAEAYIAAKNNIPWEQFCLENSISTPSKSASPPVSKPPISK